MTLDVVTDPLPLQIDRDGVVRVGGTRVTLETIIAAFTEGATAEEIVQQYPSVALADVYAVIGYYLRHRVEVEAYVQRSREQALAVRQENARRTDLRGLRERLLARQSSTDH